MTIQSRAVQAGSGLRSTGSGDAAEKKMDPALKAKWIAALRSGEFKQARERLYDGEGYCCLGVLCTVAGLKIRTDGGGVVGHGDGRASFSSYEPIFDLVGGYEKSHQLSMRNDGSADPELHKHDFSEIADFIEANL